MAALALRIHLKWHKDKMFSESNNKKSRLTAKGLNELLELLNVLIYKNAKQRQHRGSSCSAKEHHNFDKEHLNNLWNYWENLFGTEEMKVELLEKIYTHTVYGVKEKHCKGELCHHGALWFGAAFAICWWEHLTLITKKILRFIMLSFRTTSRWLFTSCSTIWL